MSDWIMSIGGFIFGVLFVFLFFIFTVFILSLSRKRTANDYEPTVSIIIPAYNEEKNIGQTLEAIKHQDYPKEKMEIIVVDDGSTDNTIAVAEQYDCKILKEKHKGKTAALTAAAKQAKHDIIFTLDADTTIEQHCLREIVKPFSQKDVGATTGNSKVSSTKSFIEMFQNIEYHYNNLIRVSFSRLFNDGIWFFGALACYRKSVIEEIGYFKSHTLTEDMDTALEIKRAGYRTVNVHNALGHTIVPSSIPSLCKQRSRWWIGTLQALIKNKSLFKPSSSLSIGFLFVNQFWWSFYAIISLPLILYQVNYWLPSNSGDIASVFWYLFRWFTLSGPAYILYKIPEWGISWYSFFGVLSGIISSIMIIAGICMFKDKLNSKNFFALFFYFPYTIVLNMFILLSLISYPFIQKKYFIK